MKLPKKSRKKPLIIAILLIVIAAVSVYTYMRLSSDDRAPTSKDTSSPSSKITEDQVKNDNTSTDVLPNKAEDNTPVSTVPGNDTGDDVISSQLESPKIERASQSGSSIKVVASLQKASSGDCKLRLTKGSNTFTRSTRIVVGPSYYTCSFTIPVAELSSGTWQLTVQHLSGNYVASSNTQEIEINS